MRCILALSFSLTAILLYSCGNQTTGPAEPSGGWATIRISPVPAAGAVTFDPPGICSGNDYRFEPGTIVTATAVPAEGCEFKSWTVGTGVLQTSSIQIVATTDSVTVISATFNRPPMGIIWTKQESGTHSGLVSVTGGNGLIVVVGNNGTILTSTDGVSWTPRSSGLNVCLNSVIWTGSRFVAVGDSSAILTSTDGSTWAVKNGPAADHLESVAWNGRELIAVGGRMINSGLTSNEVLASPDGEIWTGRSGGSGIWYSVTWSAFGFVAGGYDFNFSTVSDNSTFSLYRSVDGKRWRFWNCSIEQYASINSIIYHDGIFFVAGGSRRTGDPFASLYYTTDFDNWKSMRSPTDSTLNSVAWTGANYVAVGDGGTIITADPSSLDDWSPWETVPSGVDADLYEVACTGTKMVAVGYGGTILTSNCRCDDPAGGGNPLINTWKAVSTTVTNPDGTKETTVYDSTVTRVFTFLSDNRLTIATYVLSMEPQILSGTWVVQGTSLTFNVSDKTGETSYPPYPGTYSISGSTLTWTISVEQDGQTASLTEVMELF